MHAHATLVTEVGPWLVGGGHVGRAATVRFVFYRWEAPKLRNFAAGGRQCGFQPTDFQPTDFPTWQPGRHQPTNFVRHGESLYTHATVKVASTPVQLPCVQLAREFTLVVLPHFAHS